MEALGDVLAPYSDSIAKIAGTITTLQFLSGIVLLNDIRKKGKSDAYPPEPFVGGIVLSILTLKQGAIMGDGAMINTNIIGLCISIVFSAFFYFYASPEFKTKIWTKFGIAAVFTLTCLAYTNFEDPAKIEFRFGMLITGILVFLVGSPLLNLGDIIKRQSTEGMPFPIIFTGTIVAASWTLYGISIKNSTMAYQNIFLLMLSSIQLSLFAIYPNTPSEKATKKHAAQTKRSSSNDKKHK